MTLEHYEEPVPLPRGGLRFPVELTTPPGFRVEKPSTWPKVTGRLEYVDGRLLFMPPCGDDQFEVTASVTTVLGIWAEEHPEFSLGTNEAGMLLGGEVRAADVAVWRRRALPPRAKRGAYRRVAPVLAVEVAGQDEDEAALNEKARWYFKHGVKLVWLVLPATRTVVVLRRGTRGRRYVTGDRLPSESELPALDPVVARFFRQLDG